MNVFSFTPFFEPKKGVKYFDTVYAGKEACQVGLQQGNRLLPVYAGRDRWRVKLCSIGY